jgi:hypothetical protein
MEEAQMSNLEERTRKLLQEFHGVNTRDNFYMMTDGGDGLSYAEQMAELLEEWMGGSK